MDIAGVRTGAALKSSLQPGNWGRACAGLEQSWEQGVLVGIHSEVFSLAAESRRSACHSFLEGFFLYFLTAVSRRAKAFMAARAPEASSVPPDQLSGIYFHVLTEESQEPRGMERKGRNEATYAPVMLPPPLSLWHRRTVGAFHQHRCIVG